MPLLATYFDQFADALGFPPYAVRLVASLLLAYPLGFLFLRLPNDKPAIKHWFSLIAAVFIHFEILEDTLGFLHLSLGALTTYLIAVTVRSSLMPQIVIVLVMLHMSYVHIARMDEDSIYAKKDFTGAQMMMVIKLTSTAFSIQDGRRDEKELNDYQKDKRIKQMPSLLEFMGYVFFFGSFIVGPAFEYADYIRFCNMEMFTVKGKIHRPNGLFASLSCMTKSFTALALMIIFGNVFPISYCATEAYAKESLLKKFFYLQFAAALTRMKYYFVWKLAESTCILVGLGFNGYDSQGKALWNRVSNVNIRAYELAQNPRTLMDNWNISTNVWLRQYIYVRLKAGGGIGASLATLATFMSSAIWHGFYAGYYLTFASVSILTSLARVMRRTFRPLVVNPVTQEEHPIKPVYDVISWFLTQCSINYLVMPFQLLTFHDSWAAWRANKFIVQWCMAILYIWLVYAGGARWVRRTFGPAEAGKPKSNGAAASKQTNEKTAVGANVTYAEAPLTSS